MIVKPHNVFFVPVVEHWTSSIPSTGCLRAHGSLPNQSSCALWTCRRQSTVSLTAFCGRWFRSIGFETPCTTGAGALHCQQEVRPVSSTCWTPAALCPCSVHYIYSMVRIVRQLQPGARRRPVWEAQDFIYFIPSSQDLQSCTLFLAAAVVMRSGYWTVVIKKELRQKVKLSIYWSIFSSPTNFGS